MFLNQSYHVSEGESTSSLTRTLLAQLSPPLRQKLFAMYKIDLEMFGYDDEDLSHFLAGEKKEEDNVWLYSAAPTRRKVILNKLSA